MHRAYLMSAFNNQFCLFCDHMFIIFYDAKILLFLLYFHQQHACAAITTHSNKHERPQLKITSIEDCLVSRVRHFFFHLRLNQLINGSIAC